MSLDTYYTLGHSGLRVSRIALGAMTFGNDWAEEVMRAFDDLVQSGKVRHIGLSDTPAWYAARAQTLAEWHDYAPIINLQLEYSLVERNIEREFIPLGLELGMGVTVWSPLANGLLTGKYRQQDGTFSGSGRMESQKDNRNPAFQKFNQRNWEIVAELDRVAKELDLSMAQVAIAWTLSRPGVASTIIGATNRSQLVENLQSLDFEIPTELAKRLDAVSRPESQFPYSFFESEVQGGLHGGKPIGAKPVGYFPIDKFTADRQRSSG